jgi:thioredoxin 2
LADEPVCGACGKAILQGVHAIDATGLKAVLAQDSVPVIIDFWAPWCGPCLGFAPTFAAAAQKFGGKLVFVKVDTEANQALGAQYNIRSIPTLAVFKGTQELTRISGALPARQLEELIAKVLNHAQS